MGNWKSTFAELKHGKNYTKESALNKGFLYLHSLLYFFRSNRISPWKRYTALSFADPSEWASIHTSSGYSNSPLHYMSDTSLWEFIGISLSKSMTPKACKSSFIFYTSQSNWIWKKPCRIAGKRLNVALVFCRSAIVVEGERH